MKDLSVAITLKNYRCFPDEAPATFVLEDDFTAFVGPNNVGKSTLLKFFYEMRRVFETLNNVAPLRNALREPGSVQANVEFYDVRDQMECFSVVNSRPMTIELSLSVARQLFPTPDLEIRISRERELSMRFLVHGAELQRQDTNDDGTVTTMSGNLEFDLGPYLALFRIFAGSVYLPAQRNAVSASGGRYGDLSIGTAFVGSWRDMKLGDTNRRLNNAAQDLTEEIRKVFGFEKLEINPNADASNLTATIDGRMYRLEEVGAGIAHFIICLAFIATKLPRIVFIDEPEANLHPKMQMELLTGIATRAEHGVVFATHSIGLVRASAARAYSLRPVRHGVAQVTEFGDARSLSEQLGELSFSAYQELGFKKLLLVEGSTETSTLR